MNKINIERAARDLQKQMWLERTRLCPDGVSHPLAMLDPAIAAQILGVDFEYYEELGRFGHRGTHFEIAGLLDRQASKIAVATRFPLETTRFTGAHEIGHWLLHPGEIMHRDRPIKGLTNETYPRTVQEKEADYFAACFLMPRKLLIAIFESVFLTKIPFVFDDRTAFLLCPSDPDSLLRADEGTLDRALSLASVGSYAGRHFNSLSKQFRVSISTMAIRLRELNLIQE